MPTRAQYRESIGRQLGRSYYAKSTTNPTYACTTTNVLDALRTENTDYWDGAAIFILGVERLVNGSTPNEDALTHAGLFLNTALPSIPGVGVNYELLKGFSFADVHEAIDRAHTLSYPYVYDTQTTLVAETANVENLIASAAGNWRNISEVNRLDVGSPAPGRYHGLRENYDYTWRVEQGQWRFIPHYTTEVGATLQFVADVPLSFFPSDDTTTSIANLDLIVAGALWWLYDKGANPDEGALQDKWSRESDKWATRFEMLKHQFSMVYRGKKKVIRPAVEVVNTGYQDRFNGE